jgi:hypothetical protein
MGTKIHQGAWVECKGCNPEAVAKRERKERKDRKPKGSITLDVYVRRQVAAEIGEAEPTKEQKFALLQKFGSMAPRIDRRISKPAWKDDTTWNQQLNEWYKATKGLVPVFQIKRDSRADSTTNRFNSRKPNSGNTPKVARSRPSETKHKTRTFRPNSAQ